MHHLKQSILSDRTNQFQYKTVLQWNEAASKIAKVIIPHVFLCDEITTDGYRKCLVELMTKHGILIKEKEMF